MLASSPRAVDYERSARWLGRETRNVSDCSCDWTIISPRVSSSQETGSRLIYRKETFVTDNLTAWNND